MSALHVAAKYNNPAVVQLLIDNGADIDISNDGVEFLFMIHLLP